MLHVTDFTIMQIFYYCTSIFSNIILADHLYPFYVVNVCRGPLGGVPATVEGHTRPRGTPREANPAITKRINVPKITFETQKSLNINCLE